MDRKPTRKELEQRVNALREEKGKLKAKLQRTQEKIKADGISVLYTTHKIKNILMGILGEIDMVCSDIDTSHPHHKRLRSIKQNVGDVEKLNEGFLKFPKPTNTN